MSHTPSLTLVIWVHLVIWAYGHNQCEVFSKNISKQMGVATSRRYPMATTYCCHLFSQCWSNEWCSNLLAAVLKCLTFSNSLLEKWNFLKGFLNCKIKHKWTIISSPLFPFFYCVKRFTFGGDGEGASWVYFALLIHILILI